MVRTPHNRPIFKGVWYEWDYLYLEDLRYVDAKVVPDAVQAHEGAVGTALALLAPASGSLGLR